MATARRAFSDGVSALEAAHPEHDRYSMDDIAEHVVGKLAAALASRAASEHARVIAIFAPFLDRLPADAKAEAMAMMDRLEGEER